MSYEFLPCPFRRGIQARTVSPRLRGKRSKQVEQILPVALFVTKFAVSHIYPAVIEYPFVFQYYTFSQAERFVVFQKSQVGV